MPIANATLKINKSVSYMNNIIKFPGSKNTHTYYNNSLDNIKLTFNNTEIDQSVMWEYSLKTAIEDTKIAQLEQATSDLINCVKNNASCAEFITKQIQRLSKTIK